MREPINGIKVELNFARHEAERIGLVPSWPVAGENTSQATAETSAGMSSY